MFLVKMILPKIRGLSKATSPIKRTNDMTYDSRPETWEHIHKVRGYLSQMVALLMERAQEHDQSKLVSPEVEAFNEAVPLSELEYGSEEYEKSKESLAPALTHHYAKNSHHPEHYEDGINDMTLVDLVEMVCDWKASTERQNDGNIRMSLTKNRDKYKISIQLYQIIENTIKSLGW